MPRAGFEPAIPATKRLQTYALDRADDMSDCRMLIVLRLLVKINYWTYKIRRDLQSYDINARKKNEVHDKRILTLCNASRNKDQMPSELFDLEH
jgi:hypothetical protein